jgi:hypothetical protein
MIYLDMLGFNTKEVVYNSETARMARKSNFGVKIAPRGQLNSYLLCKLCKHIPTPSCKSIDA